MKIKRIECICRSTFLGLLLINLHITSVKARKLSSSPRQRLRGPRPSPNSQRDDRNDQNDRFVDVNERGQEDNPDMKVLCSDLRDWSDSDGNGCDWYEEHPSSCGLDDRNNDFFGYTSARACCTCDGGTYHSVPSAFDDSSCAKIQVKATNEYLYLEDELLSTHPHEPDDDEFNTRFLFAKQFDNGSYQILVESNGLFLHEDGDGDRLLSTRYQTDDSLTKFFLEYQEDDGTFKIRVKENGRYWHADAGNTTHISTVSQPDDDFVRFQLVSC